MSAHSCKSCQTPFSERAVFCSNCPTQVRCKECREIFESNARFCIICGAPFLSVNQSQSLISVTPVSPNTAINTIDFRRSKSGSQRLTANFTDVTSSHFSGVLGQVLVAGLSLKGRESDDESDKNLETNTQRKLPFGAEQKEAQSTAAGPSGKNEEETVAPPPQDDQVEDNAILRKLFRRDNDAYRLTDKRLGGNNSTSDFSRRLTCLFLYMLEINNKGNATRESINTILQDNKAYNGNTRTWIANATELVKYSDGYGLSDSGRDYAIIALLEIKEKGTSIKPFSAVSKSRSKDPGDSKTVSETKSKKPKAAGEDKSSRKGRIASSNRLGPIEILRKLIDLLR